MNNFALTSRGGACLSRLFAEEGIVLTGLEEAPALVTVSEADGARQQLADRRHRGDTPRL